MAVKIQPWIGENLTGSYPSLLGYWLLMNSGKGKVLVFNYEPSGESSNLVVTGMALVKLCGSQNKTKEVINIRMRLVGIRGVCVYEGGGWSPRNAPC